MKDKEVEWPRVCAINDSTNLLVVSYDTETEEMKVEFGNDNTYIYSGVSSSAFGTIVASESAGKAFQKLLKKFNWEYGKVE